MVVHEIAASGLTLSKLAVAASMLGALAKGRGASVYLSQGCHCEQSEAISCRKCMPDRDCFIPP
jgi:hypothetical protein